MQTEEMRQQAIHQCEAVSRMAKALLDISKNYERMLTTSPSNSVINQIGDRTAGQLEELGTLLQHTGSEPAKHEEILAVMHKARAVWPRPAS
jgi:hypothetical protein